MNLKCLLLGLAIGVCAEAAEAFDYVPERTSASVSIKVPGNKSRQYPLNLRQLQNDRSAYVLEAAGKLPLSISQKVDNTAGKLQLNVCITALEDVYFNYSQQVQTGFRHDDCQFYMPGFWYRRNLRSPKEAPSFHTSDSWLVREDRLSAPLTGIYSEKEHRFMTVNRIDEFAHDALSTHREGEIILSGKTSLGFTGFENQKGIAALCFGFPYREAPRSYIRKLTLAPEVEAFQLLKKGETVLLTWEIVENKAEDFSGFIRRAWEYCYDTYAPQPVDTPYSIADVKQTISHFFVNSLVDTNPLVYNSGIHLRTDDCKKNGQAEVGFIGRVLLNAFNALEYGWETNREDLTANSKKVFDSYLKNGFTPAGFFKESVNFDKQSEDPVHSIRRQSEGIYAMFHFLAYEKEQGRRHPEWEQRMKQMLDRFLKLQNADGSFPRKFLDDCSIVDKSGGSTPSATLPLVMGYKYFKDKRYLASAKRTADYLERELISKADYFSSTLDANCEDKEASLYAATATYYLSLITKGDEHRRYADLARKASYFALSWYYVWDVPFAPGQMLGDAGLKTRGWGNVSVENNHIDVFVFEFASVLQWLSKEYNEPRFAHFAKVISTSMRQLLPYEGHLCEVAKTGYYPEVVQHTNWDYGKNGKGYYNDIFAPGWTVASLWELYTPGRAERFLGKGSGNSNLSDGYTDLKGVADPAKKTSRQEYYANPVINYSLPDPTIIKGDDGYFYLYATENIRNLPIHRSKDLVNWNYVGTAFTDATRPSFEPKGGIWAPDINKIGDKYVMYYSMSVWGGEWTCGIGIATADRPEGPFTDQGKLFRSNEINIQNCIDPFYIEDHGKKYLFWGSFRGIYGTELTEDGLALKKDAPVVKVAGTAYEGTYIHKKDGYYYFFASIGRCCEGLKSTYTTVVGRSKSLFGPYVDKKGGAMLDNKHEILVKANEAFVGTGHNSELVTDKSGADWMFYHAVSVANPEGRVLMMDRVHWKKGWPSVQNSTPSLKAVAPNM